MNENSEVLKAQVNGPVPKRATPTIATTTTILMRIVTCQFHLHKTVQGMWANMRNGEQKQLYIQQIHIFFSFR